MKKNSAKIEGSVTVSVGDRRLRIPMSMPFGNIRPLRMLPVFHSVADRFVGHFAELAEEGGERISCTKGCGACCRQLVPISEAETHWIREVVESLPEPQRQRVLDRFEAAVSRLADRGLLEPLENLGGMDKEQRRRTGLEYFSQSIDCPFLEQGACSIHGKRPISCREYLVTSPAENCSSPNAADVRCVDVKVKVSNGVARALSSDGRPVWVPLILALRWSAAHEENAEARPAMEIAKAVFGELS